MYDLTTAARCTMFEAFRIGAINAVKAAAPTKNTSSPTKIHDMPLRRRFFLPAADSATAVLAYGLPV
jgi:hypothetical protein